MGLGWPGWVDRDSSQPALGWLPRCPEMALQRPGWTFPAGPTLQKGPGAAMIRGGHASTEETHVLPVRPTLDVVPTLPHSSRTVGSEASQ